MPVKIVKPSSEARSRCPGWYIKEQYMAFVGDDNEHIRYPLRDDSGSLIVCQTQEAAIVEILRRVKEMEVVYRDVPNQIPKVVIVAKIEFEASLRGS